jgi:hypothetical protein
MASDLPYNAEVRSLLDDLIELNPRLGPHELIALWFDALYFPCQHYVGPEGQREWRACFSESELNALAKFHEVFDSVADELPKTADWAQSPLWRNVSAAALSALQEMNSHA